MTFYGFYIISDDFKERYLYNFDFISPAPIGLFRLDLVVLVNIQIVFS